MLQRAFGTAPCGQPATLYTLTGDDGRVARVTDHGATLVELHAPDRHGVTADVVCGFDHVDGYLGADNPYFGATIGRVANRIAKGRFTLDGNTYQLACNEPPHHLHGGAERSLDKVLWEVVDRAPDRVALRYRSPDGEEGYPGEVEVRATYRFEGDTLTVTYRATTGATTPLNLTNHAYFNLAGAGAGDVLDHELSLQAEAYSEVDAQLIPTGRVLPVEGTPLDLRDPRPIRGGVAALREMPGAGGIDHNLVLRGTPGELRPAAVLQEPVSGRVLELSTDQRCLQVYSGNQLAPPIIGKQGQVYGRHGAVCLEPQGFPDAVNHPHLPSVLLAPGQVYEHRSRYRLTTTT